MLTGTTELYKHSGLPQTPGAYCGIICLLPFSCHMYLDHLRNCLGTVVTNRHSRVTLELLMLQMKMYVSFHYAGYFKFHK